MKSDQPSINLRALKQVRPLRIVVVAVWFVVLTFPLMVVRVNTITNTVDWRWGRIALVGVGTIALAFLWQFFMARQTLRAGAPRRRPDRPEFGDQLRTLVAQPKVKIPSLIAGAAIIVLFPFVSSMYQTNIVSTALTYVVLGLGLNVIIGFGGMLQLGHVAFFLVGAYTYGLLNTHLGVGFWVALPIGGLVATVFGVLLALPVLRLKGDYLGIVTLAFAEILRIVVENWSEVTNGPNGIAGIARPGLFGATLRLQGSATYMYFIMVLLVAVAVFVINRLENSRLGRAWVAMKEDDIASEAMGVDIMRTKLTAFAIGAFWAGLAGVAFAGRTTFINPGSFTIWESVLMLGIVVLGGTGSSLGVFLGAFIVILLPEYLRAFSQYRMLVFGAILVMMMVFRPGGIIQKRRRVYRLADVPDSVADTVVPATSEGGGDGT